MFRTIVSAWTLVFLSGQAQAHPDPTEILKEYEMRIHNNPSDLKDRGDRAWLLLDEKNSSAQLQADIDSLLSHPKWRALGLRLQALNYYNQGRFSDSKKVLAQISTSELKPLHYEILSRIDLSLGDTVSAIHDFQKAWMLSWDESVFMEMVRVLKLKGDVPDSILQMGLKIHERSPGAFLTIFEAYKSKGDIVSLKQCRALAYRAQSTFWPQSPDWKIRYAQILIALAQLDEAKSVLVEALDLLEENPRLRLNLATTPPLRKEIFTLLTSLEKE